MTKASKRRVPGLLKETERAVLTTVMFNAGVLPLEEIILDQSKILSQVQPEDARKMKRKFRKIWRRLVRDEGQLAARECGKGKSNPTRHERRERKRLVQQHFYNDFVRPILDKFEKDDRNFQKKPSDFSE